MEVFTLSCGSGCSQTLPNQYRLLILLLVIYTNPWWNPIAEDTLPLGHGTWRNQMDTDKHVSSMLVNFHSVGNCCILLVEKSHQRSYPDVYMSRYNKTWLDLDTRLCDICTWASPYWLYLGFFPQEGAHAWNCKASQEYTVGAQVVKTP